MTPPIEIPPAVQRIAVVCGSPSPFGPYRLILFQRQDYGGWLAVPGGRTLKAANVPGAKEEAARLLGISVPTWGLLYYTTDLPEGDWVEAPAPTGPDQKAKGEQ